MARYCLEQSALIVLDFHNRAQYEDYCANAPLPLTLTLDANQNRPARITISPLDDVTIYDGDEEIAEDAIT